jgi:ubiquinone/menaquinone biosynthesis C-methylase UbiE
MNTRSGSDGAWPAGVGAARTAALGEIDAGREATPALTRYDGSEPVWSHAVPPYLMKNYWWAYVHPRAVRFWERQWLINLILFGNFVKLRDAALSELGASLGGRTLEVACVYGDFSVKLAERIAPGASLDVVDVLPIQLRNLRRKLPDGAPVTLHLGDSTALGFADATFDQAIVFFLLHEQPAGVREQTLKEAVRVVRPGGKLVIVDYHRPSRWHPLHLVLLKPILRVLEPFSPDLWTHEISEWLPAGIAAKAMRKQTFFGGLYQKLAVTL